MYYPSGKLMKYVSSESIGIWISYSHDYNVVEIVAKMPLTTIKGILLGAKIEFHFSIITGLSRHLVLGLTVYDIIDNPTIYTYAIRDKIETKGLSKLCKGEYDSIKITIYDDFTSPTVWSFLNLSDDFIKSLRAEYRLGFSTIKNTDMSIKVTDALYAELMPHYEADNSYKSNTVTEQLSFNKLNNILAIHPDIRRTVFGYNLSEGKDGSEGYMQEDMVAYILSHVFGKDIIHPPLFIDGEKVRELTDVAVIDGDNTLLIESKGGGLIEKGRILDNFRRKSGVTKEINKAIRQVEGVSKRCLSDINLINSDSQYVATIKKESLKHIIIVVTELLYEDPNGDFNVRTNKIFSDTGCKVHVMSISALANFVKLARLHRGLFWACLNDRHKLSFDNLTYFIKDVDSSLPIWIK